MAAPMERLITAYEVYVKLLRDELNEVVPLAAAHGWKTTRFEQGKEARTKITEISGKLRR